MKANEYVKQNGWTMARKAVAECTYGYGIDLADLKRLVDSHDLVEECGGLDKAKERIALEEKLPNPNVFYMLIVSGAIDDVESCK